MLILLLSMAIHGIVHASSPVIDVLTVKGTVNPVLVDYIKRGISQAERDNAILCVIQLDTPGGLDTSMRDIVQSILASKVPVVVYVAPSGARAASAGVFITMAAHVAAMAPETAIGAAHPVALSTGETVDPTMEEKAVNDAVAFIKSLAESHGRNVEWAEKSVRESASITEQEAIKTGVIEIIAEDLKSLLIQLDGHEVKMSQNEIITIHTGNAAIRYLKMNWMEEFLYVIADPNIAYILLSLAALGIFAEIFNPGLIFPGIIGGICGLLAFYALGMLPVNLTGILLVVLGFGFFIAEALTSGFGLLFTGGIVSLVIGSLILFKGGGPEMRVNPVVITIVVLAIAGFFGFVVERAVKIHRKQATTGKEELIGHLAITRTSLNPVGQVFLDGERWTAISESGEIQPNETVVITRVEGLKLYVKKQESGGGKQS